MDMGDVKYTQAFSTLSRLAHNPRLLALIMTTLVKINTELQQKNLSGGLANANLKEKEAKVTLDIVKAFRYLKVDLKAGNSFIEILIRMLHREKPHGPVNLFKYVFQALVRHEGR